MTLGKPIRPEPEKPKERPHPTVPHMFIGADGKLIYRPPTPKP